MDRENIINHYTKGEFMDFLNNDINGKILELFNEEGIGILKNSKLLEDRINYILTYSQYKNHLLQDFNFLDVVLKSDVSSYYASLNNLDFNIYDILLRRCMELNLSSSLIANLFSYFDIKYKLNVMEKWTYSNELLYEILKIDEVSVVKKIIENFDIDLLKYEINLRSFFSKAKESVLAAKAKRNVNNIVIDEINIPPKMITKDLCEKIWNNYNVFVVRQIINDMEYSTDVSLIVNYIKEQEEKIISNYNGLLSKYQNLYDAFKKFKYYESLLKDDNITDVDFYYKSKREYIKLINECGNKNMYDEVSAEYNENGLDGVLSYFNRLSENMISNYIIDYHFEENYHNVIIDIRELLKFYYGGNIVISKERVELYSKISNIDYLSIEEKKEMHNSLKKLNIMEMFYDDMSVARYIVSEAIKEYSLSSETIKQYRDETLTKKYGVDVYVLNGDYFFGIVKTGMRTKDKLPTGHSYSLIGTGGLAVFGDLMDSNTFLYDSDSMNPEQLVHAFPFDSFTYYHPYEYSTNATRRVNTLKMPEDLVKESFSYNELLILEKGLSETDIDNKIPELKRLALYCIDSIREQNIQKAKSNNIGILLVNSSNYKSEFNNSTNFYELNYLEGDSDLDKFEVRR